MGLGRLSLVFPAAILGVVALAALTYSRMAACAAVPLLAGELLPNANLALSDEGAALPRGWAAAAPGVAPGAFAVDGDGRALQLIGIANYVQTPPIAVHADRAYCFAGRAITDSRGEGTRLRAAFRWLDAQGRLLAEDVSPWQMVVQWRADAPPAGWSFIRAAFRAPAGATTLLVRLHPASDERIYLDDLHVRRSLAPQRPPAPPVAPVVAPWPQGRRAALSFSFDWETTMGGLIHSRSVDDPNADQDPIARGLRMREGVTTTLALFRPYGIHATYYANGYNFLNGNTARRQFMGNPTFAWASQANGWPTDAWTSRPWFADDPYGTVQSRPAWYFGDLAPLLLREGHDIQSHTFSHLYGGLASAAEWRADMEAWLGVAAERGVPPPRSLAFPWSSSAGMTYANWDVIEASGITSVTRTNWNQRQYHLVSVEDPRCRPVPGHERILACPDFYLTERSAPQARELIDRAIAAGGMLDLWAHTEEVVSPGQIAAWGEVVRYAADQRDAGKLWIAPLAEIAAWQQALAQLTVENQAASVEGDPAPLRFVVSNHARYDLHGLTLSLPFAARHVTTNGEPAALASGSILTFDVRAGQSLEVSAWPA